MLGLYLEYFVAIHLLVHVPRVVVDQLFDYCVDELFCLMWACFWGDQEWDMVPSTDFLSYQFVYVHPVIRSTQSVKQIHGHFQLFKYIFHVLFIHHYFEYIVTHGCITLVFLLPVTQVIHTLKLRALVTISLHNTLHHIIGYFEFLNRLQLFGLN